MERTSSASTDWNKRTENIALQCVYLSWARTIHALLQQWGAQEDPKSTLGGSEAIVNSVCCNPRLCSVSGLRECGRGAPQAYLDGEHRAYHLLELPQRREVLVRKHQSATAGFDNDMRGA